MGGGRKGRQGKGTERVGEGKGGNEEETGQATQTLAHTHSSMVAGVRCETSASRCYVVKT